MPLVAREKAEAVPGGFRRVLKAVPFPVAVYPYRRRQDVATLTARATGASHPLGCFAGFALAT